MGFYFRKSANLGPFRINLSKSGLGYSVGGRGFRTGRSATGHHYTRLSLPGTGLGYTASKGCALTLAAGLALALGGAAALKVIWELS